MEKTSSNTVFTPEYVAGIGLDRWVPACGGQEIKFYHEGTPWLYVYNHAQDEHGYLNLHTDIVQENAPWDKS